jgi:Kef-type K+ transport system membrane component KefB
MNVLLLLTLSGLMHVVRSFSAIDEPGSSGTSLALGYLLVAGYFAGKVFHQVGLPKLTGYLMLGVCVGPSGMALVSRYMVESLSLVNGMAIAMIALTAGTELELRQLKPLLRTVTGVAIVGVLGTTVLLSGAVWLARGYLPFFADLTTVQAVSISCVLGVVMVAQSPAVVVALRDELRADGPVARSVLAVVVLADLMVILMFALLSPVAKATFGAGADILGTLGALSWEIGGSLGFGASIGVLVVVYLRKVKVEAALLLPAGAFLIAEVGSRFGLDPLLLALAAGALVRNTSEVADELHERLQVSATPVYVLFFCVAGANLHLDALPVVWFPATLFVVVRGVGLLVGSRLGARLAGAPLSVQRYIGFGLLPQAGLALALALLFTRTFPEFGAAASALVLSVVGLNEILAPAAYRYALVKSGEAGKEAPRSNWPESNPAESPQPST